MVFGSDRPYAWDQSAAGATALQYSTTLSATEREAIGWANAATLIPRLAQ